MNFENAKEYANYLDSLDELSAYKNQFIFPTHNNKPVIYFTGNSLGLQPKNAKDYVDEVMQDWANMAVEGHFYAKNAWWEYHEKFSEALSKIVGAKPTEVSVMNTLTVNLHLLMVSFYKPNKNRYKILCEEKAFPSDQYMLQSQVKFHGYNPKDAIIEIKKRNGEHNIRTQDILDKIDEIGNELALILIGGVNYYTGQVFDIEVITKKAKEYNVIIGWDLAHAAGNIKLELNNWEVDFAAWCSYKYMNAGPGSVSGYFVHEKHHNDSSLNRFAGWYGHNKERRFLMEQNFEPINNANGWQISNLPILSMAPYLASLELFNLVGMDKLIAKRNKITAYLEFILKDIEKETPNANFEIITPTDDYEKACQLSVFFHGKGKELFNYLMSNGVVVDWREPNVIRFAPVPFYTSFSDIYNFGQILKNAYN